MQVRPTFTRQASAKNGREQGFEIGATQGKLARLGCKWEGSVIWRGGQTVRSKDFESASTSQASDVDRPQVARDLKCVAKETARNKFQGLRKRFEAVRQSVVLRSERGTGMRLASTLTACSDHLRICPSFMPYRRP
jgi:hypothetical protein